MFKKHLDNSRSRQGFTLVEVIVVAVIVAILSAVAVPLYLGYINSAKVSTANANAGACATYLTSARNSGATAVTNFGASMASGAILSYTPEGGEAVTFTIPDSTTIAATGDVAAGGTLIATYKGKASKAVNY
jgi:prepilin-type N-terminal cleavage/methylation domain-containing protein